MRLYHFTSLGHLPVILATGGLWRGEVPVDDGTQSLRGTWLTTDPDPKGHGLTGSTANKRAVRIAVDLDDATPDLSHWLSFTRTRAGYLEPHLVRRLVKSGGGHAKADTWYVYPNQIPPEQFAAIELSQGNGVYVPATPEQIAAAKAHEGLHDAVVTDFEEMRAKIGARRAA
ncbi:hypothetical protein B2G69_07700 [Methylorubrum zatmanii]|nr:hypothetical protein [Methylorubrum zatmanii]ARO54039.1 hypothetical protein B2G69_07700 [Methylorubrum zatmanii]